MKNSTDSSEFINSETSSESFTTADEGDNSEEPEVTLEIPVHISNLSNENLKQRLLSYGIEVGPMFRQFRKLYEKRLARLELQNSSVRIEKKLKYSDSLERLFRAEERGESLELGEVEENSIREDFSMRSPVEADKEASSFCYLLINPSKISQTEGHTFREFIAAIFYVGQGKRSRPLKHMRIPAKHRNNTGIKSHKDRRVLEIWDSGYGIISLHIFANIYEAEAFIREAAMIEAIGIRSTTKKPEMSDEEDYMSETFLSTMKDIKPGVSALPSQRRLLKLNARKETTEEEIRNLPKKADLEKQRREEALSKPVGAESKGFSLLAKMGYKPGMSLGKPREGSETGIKVPIPIEMKAGRSGLGHETHEKEQQQKRVELHFKKLEFQAKNQHILLKDYRKRKRDLTAQKQLIGDIIRSRKACQELDIRQGRDLPAESWFWPIYVNKKDEFDEESGIPLKAFKNNEDDLEELLTYRYANGNDAPPEENLNDLEEEELLSRLEAMTEYLRGAHHYCIWCGCAYDLQEELLQQCPGPTRKDHDE